jgi:transcriptional regulator with XRE-family HTH domain
MNYGKAIKLARTMAGLTQAELASRAKLDTSHISLIEQGKRKPSTGALDRLSRALKLPHHLLLLLGTEQADLVGARQSEIELIGRSLVQTILKHEPAKTARKDNPRKRRSA